MELDYSKFVDRLTSFNDRGWPPEIPVFIKALAEAGFSYSGESDIVFCYQCGAVVCDWKDDDDPLKKHGLLNKDCLFLQKRLIRLCNGNVVPPPYLNEDQTFDWVKGQGIVRKRKNDSDCDGEERSVSCIPQEEKDVKRRSVDESMKMESYRLRSFATCPINKNWPPVEQLSKFGFYWLERDRVMICFSCGCEVDNWETVDQDIAQRHKKLSNSCSFVNGLQCGNVEIRDDSEIDINLTQLNISADSVNQERQNTSTDVTWASNPNNYSDSSKRANFMKPTYITSPVLLSIPDKMISSVDLSSSNVSPTFPCTAKLDTTFSVPDSVSSYDNQENIPVEGHIHMRTYSEVPVGTAPQGIPHINRSSSYPPNHENSVNANVSPVHVPIDLSSQSVRLKTFLTYPKDAHVQAVELAEAGFYYINREDCVKCYKCNVMLGKWSKGDTAWNEHRRYSTNCVLVQEKFGRSSSLPYKQQLQQQLQPPLQTTEHQPGFLGYHDDPFDPNLLQRFSPRHLSPTQPRFLHNITDRRINSYDPYGALSPSDDGTEDPLNNSWPLNMFRNERRTYYPSGSQTSLNKSPIHTNSHLLPGKSHLSGGYSRNDSFPDQDQFSTQRNNTECYRDNFHEHPSNLLDVRDGHLEATEYLQISEQLIHPEHYDKRMFDNPDVERPLVDMQQISKEEVSKRYGKHELPLHLTAPGQYDGRQNTGNCLENKNIRNMQMDRSINYHRQNSDFHNISMSQYDCSHDDHFNDRKDCKICMDAAVEVTFVPCGHLVVCQSCSQGLTMCPICRKNVEESVRTYFYGN